MKDSWGILIACWVLIRYTPPSFDYCRKNTLRLLSVVGAQRQRLWLRFLTSYFLDSFTTTRVLPLESRLSWQPGDLPFYFRIISPHWNKKWIACQRVNSRLSAMHQHRSKIATRRNKSNCMGRCFFPACEVRVNIDNDELNLQLLVNSGPSLSSIVTGVLDLLNHVTVWCSFCCKVQ